MTWDLEHLPTAQGTKIKFLIPVQTSCLTLAELYNIRPSGATCLAPRLPAVLWTRSRKERLHSVPAAPCLASLGLPLPCLHHQAGGVHLVSLCLGFPCA